MFVNYRFQKTNVKTYPAYPLNLRSSHHDQPLNLQPDETSAYALNLNHNDKLDPAQLNVKAALWFPFHALAQVRCVFVTMYWHQNKRYRA